MATVNHWQAAGVACVRGHIEKLNERLGNAVEKGEPLDVERLARALGALSEVERVLDGRPLPGSRRPVDDPKPRQIVKDIEPT
jgi:hypothetical protein